MPRQNRPEQELAPVQLSQYAEETVRQLRQHVQSTKDESSGEMSTAIDAFAAEHPQLQAEIELMRQMQTEFEANMDMVADISVKKIRGQI